MTKQEFDAAFKPMCRALRVDVHFDQAVVFYDEFKAHDQRDFAHACRELSMGNAGFLPKLVFFRDNVLAAKEMRIAKQSSPTRDPVIDLRTVFSSWRETEPEMAGKSDFHKGELISQTLRKKLDDGEAVYTLREEDTYAFWSEPIPLSEKGQYGEKVPWGVDGYRWIKTKWKTKPV